MYPPNIVHIVVFYYRRISFFSFFFYFINSFEKYVIFKNITPNIVNIIIMIIKYFPNILSHRISQLKQNNVSVS